MNSTKFTHKWDKINLYLIVSLLFITAIPRILAYKKYNTGFSNDSYEYLSLAHNLIYKSEFSISLELHNMDGGRQLKEETIYGKKFPLEFTKKYPPKKTMFRMPGYPLFIALIFKIFSEDFRYISWIQIFLMTCNAILLFFIVKNYLNKNYLSNNNSIISFVAVTLVFSLHPGSIIWSRNILRENLEIFLITCCIYLYMNIQRRYFNILLGFFLGALILTLQSMFYVIPLFISVKVLIYCYRKYIKKFRYINFNFKKVFISLLIATFIIQFWCFRNLKQFGYYTLSSYKLGAFILGYSVLWESEFNNNRITDIERLIKIYKPKETVRRFLIKASNRSENNEHRRILRQIYITNDQELIKLDKAFLNYSIQILLKNPQVFVKHFFQSLYGTYRIDYGYSVSKFHFGEVRYPLSFKKIMKEGINLFDIGSVLCWLFFFFLFFIFFLIKIPFFIKCLFIIYLLPYIFLPAVESRVTLIFNIFITLSFGYVILYTLKRFKKI